MVRLIIPGAVAGLAIDLRANLDTALIAAGEYRSGACRLRCVLLRYLYCRKSLV
jgi:hypothetical protein